MNKAFKKAFETGNYICPKCGKSMQFENEWKDTLVCVHCGYDMDIEHYGLTDEEYNDLYPRKQDIIGITDEYDDEL